MKNCWTSSQTETKLFLWMLYYHATTQWQLCMKFNDLHPWCSQLTTQQMLILKTSMGSKFQKEPECFHSLLWWTRTQIYGSTQTISTRKTFLTKMELSKKVNICWPFQLDWDHAPERILLKWSYICCLRTWCENLRFFHQIRVWLHRWLLSLVWYWRHLITKFDWKRERNNILKTLNNDTVTADPITFNSDNFIDRAACCKYV